MKYKKSSSGDTGGAALYIIDSFYNTFTRQCYTNATL